MNVSGLIATLIYTAARVGAVVNLKVKHFAQDGTQWCLRLGELVEEYPAET